MFKEVYYLWVKAIGNCIYEVLKWRQLKYREIAPLREDSFPKFQPLMKILVFWKSLCTIKFGENDRFLAAEIILILYSDTFSRLILNMSCWCCGVFRLHLCFWLMVNRHSWTFRVILYMRALWSLKEKMKLNSFSWVDNQAREK